MFLVFPWLPNCPKEEDCDCGVANRASRIIGGIETEVHEYPWQVGLVFTFIPVFNETPVCGGSIISNQHILTAAHCTDILGYPLNTTQIQVSVGEHDTSDSAFDLKTISKITRHPGYSPLNAVNDIAILTLSSPLTFSKSMAPICLPEGTSNTFAGDTATVIGWGRTSPGGNVSSTLQEVDLTVTTNDFCMSSYAASDVPWPILG